jgi:hypothetical protein
MKVCPLFVIMMRLLITSAENIYKLGLLNRPKEMNAVSTKVLLFNVFLGLWGGQEPHPRLQPM